MTFVAYMTSPVGFLELKSSDIGLQSISVKDGQTPLEPIEMNEHLQIAITQLEEYFDGRRKIFNLHFDFHGAPVFYQEVWRTMLMIPYGKTRSYSDIALRLGQPEAMRAVGQACHKNPIPIVIPCHRVIGKHGELGGYAYGLKMKLQLLHAENPGKFTEQGVLF